MKRRMIALMVLVLTCNACNRSKETSVAAASPVAVPPTPSPAGGRATDTFVASGPVVVENQVDVAALRDGVVFSILAQPGTAVKKGQLLAKLDDRQICADLDAATARVRSLEANVQNWQAEARVLEADRSRAEKLYEAQVIAKEQLEHAQYKAQADQYEIERETESLNTSKDVHKSLELEREKTSIIAPFDGIVARRYVRAGQRVAVGDRLFWVTALTPLEVKFTLPERFFGKIHDGDQVTVSPPDSSAETTYSARIVQVSPVVDPSSGSIEILARVLGSAPTLRPGMMVSIRFHERP